MFIMQVTRFHDFRAQVLDVITTDIVYSYLATTLMQFWVKVLKEIYEAYLYVTNPICYNPINSKK